MHLIYHKRTFGSKRRIDVESFDAIENLPELIGFSDCACLYLGVIATDRNHTNRTIRVVRTHWQLKMASIRAVNTNWR